MLLLKSHSTSRVVMASVAVVLLVACAGSVVAGANHHLQPHAEVPLFVNKIGPYSNPSETYSFYHLPFCRPPDVVHVHEGLGEHLEGDDLETSIYDLRFLVNVEWRELCKKSFTQEEVVQLMDAIKQYYYFEMLYDDLPMWGFIGTIERDPSRINLPPRFFLFTHLHFSLSFNNDQIIGANVTADRTQVVELTGEPVDVSFSYSAKWTPTDIPFNKRMEIYGKTSFFRRELEIHWLSIMNSCVLVVLLSGFLAIIVFRIVRNDYERYNEDDDADYGWKLIHGDVFRFPPNPNLFAAMFGNGIQFLSLFLFLLLLATVGVFYPGNRGSMKTASVILYAVTSVIGGYASARLYKMFGGTKWVWNVILTSTLYSVPFFLVWFVTNMVAASYRSTVALPFGTVVLIFAIWSCVGFPLTVVGGIAGRHAAVKFDPPCRTKIQPRQIPDIAWYRQWPVHVLMAGFLPFSAIYIELYYIFAALWGHKPYTLWGILLLVFFILITVTACITVAMTYFQLASEDHRWWWRSLLSGGSTAFFVFGYAIFYYFYRSEMSGTLQQLFFFGYMLMGCYAFFFMLGAVGFYSSFMFVYYIYAYLKLD